MAKNNKEHEFEDGLETENGTKGEKNIVDTVWKFFSSMRLGIILLLVLAVLSIWGTIFIAEDQYGQPDYVKFYSSIWYRGLLFLLMMNLLICSINRWKFITKSLGEPKIQVGENFIKKLGSFTSFKKKESYEEVVGTVKESIQAKGYRVFTKEEGDKTYIAADKGRHGVLGSFITHLAFIVIPLAAMYGSFTGFEGFAMVPEGDTFKVSQGVEVKPENIKDDFEVRVDKFRVDWYPNGTAKQYYSTLTVIDGGEEKFTKEINVNDPLQYKGVKFYQSSYDLTNFSEIGFESFKVEKAAEENTQDENAANENESKDEAPAVDLKPIGEKSQFKIMAQDYAQVPGTPDLYLQVNSFIPDFDPMNPSQSKSNEPNNPAIIYALYKGNTQVAMNYALVGSSITYEDNAIVIKDFKQKAATGLSIRKDPGVWYVWLGCAFLLVGMFLSYYLQHRKIWAVVTRTDKVILVDVGGTTDKNKLAFEDDFEQITELMDKEE